MIKWMLDRGALRLVLKLSRHLLALYPRVIRPTFGDLPAQFVYRTRVSFVFALCRCGAAMVVILSDPGKSFPLETLPFDM